MKKLKSARRFSGPTLIVPLAFITFGMLSYALGYAFSLQQRNFRDGAIEQRVHVMEIGRLVTDNSADMTYTFGTINADGEPVFYENTERPTRSIMHEKGDMVPGLYNPQTGQITSIAVFERPQAMVYIPKVFGGFFMLVGVLIGYFFWRDPVYEY
ncbi:hypothetical protein GCM10008927_16900 [Amylibacter ulvae]|uniref:DUF3592 domain-containing protein n=1 Tax=Paramylibacter ulvae TaxID=1651968 RepID=A0ABQ3D637_9RHOB|nr:hypothetical protein [Amylibacter ulvae]GHA51990.1 hypothetical protein GCM10008927_16900 [Amylibacter ulvae]